MYFLLNKELSNLQYLVDRKVPKLTFSIITRVLLGSLKMVKNRVAPVARQATTNISKAHSSDPFFASSSASTSVTTPRRDNFFGRSQKNHGFKAKQNFKEHELNPHSKNIKRQNRQGNTHFGRSKYDWKKAATKDDVLPKKERFKKLESGMEDGESRSNYTAKSEEEPNTKKPFDKKKWRLQKYSKKYKLEQWEEKRKKAVLKEYYQQVKDDAKIDVQKIYEQYDSDEEKVSNPKKNYVQHPDYVPPENVSPKKVKSTKKKVQLELERLKQEKQAKKEELLKKKQEREEALKLYKENKMKKQKKLNKKTKKGQPVMKGRIEMLLEKIQNS